MGWGKVFFIHPGRRILSHRAKHFHGMLFNPWHGRAVQKEFAPFLCRQARRRTCFCCCGARLYCGDDCDRRCDALANWNCALAASHLQVAIAVRSLRAKYMYNQNERGAPPDGSSGSLRACLVGSLLAGPGQVVIAVHPVPSPAGPVCDFFN